MTSEQYATMVTTLRAAFDREADGHDGREPNPLARPGDVIGIDEDDRAFDRAFIAWLQRRPRLTAATVERT